MRLKTNLQRRELGLRARDCTIWAVRSPSPQTASLPGPICTSCMTALPTVSQKNTGIKKATELLHSAKAICRSPFSPLKAQRRITHPLYFPSHTIPPPFSPRANPAL